MMQEAIVQEVSDVDLLKAGCTRLSHFLLGFYTSGWLYST